MRGLVITLVSCMAWIGSGPVALAASKSGKAAATKHAPLAKGKGKSASAKNKAGMAAKLMPLKDISKPSAKTAEKPAAVVTTEGKFNQLKKQYRAGEINDQKMWEELGNLNEKIGELNPASRTAFWQTQANLLLEGGYPILAAMTAAKSIESAPSPLSKDLNRSWTVMSIVSRQQPIDALLHEFAGRVDLKGKVPPAFGTNWHYFVAMNHEEKGATDLAMESYKKVRIADRYFLPAKYQMGLIQVEQKKFVDAENAFKSILNPIAQDSSPLDASERKDLKNYARLALAELYYERREFMPSVRAYRAIERTSPLFYSALWEQSWALFMAGYPNHALGSIHSVESPFFKDTFNPEASVLKSLVYYWMCRYDESRDALAEFMEKHSEGVEALGGFLDKRQLTEETAYQLFENLVSGVSAESLGIPKTILESAAKKPAMILIRSEYASFAEERDKFTNKGVFGTKVKTETQNALIDSHVARLRAKLGSNYLAALRIMRADFEQLYDQAQFLYVELLMSQKDHLLGKELHGNTKISSVSMKQNIAGWGKKTVSWGDSDKNEYWWDEVGFYIYQETPMCNAH